MTYNDAEGVMRVLEDEFPGNEVKVISLVDSEGHRDYGVSMEIGEPSKLGEVARLQEISEKVDHPGTLTTAPNGVRVHFR